MFIISSIILGGILFAQEKAYEVNKSEYGIYVSPNSEKPISVKEIQKAFIYKKYSLENLGKLIKFAEKYNEKDATFFEAVPGEIIGWMSTDKAQNTQIQTFQISKGQLKEINTTIGENDLKKLDKYGPKNSNFDLNSGLYEFQPFLSNGSILKKIKNGDFYLTSNVTLRYDDINKEMESYDIEYTTKDFKTFNIKRMKPLSAEKWIEIKN